MRLALSSSESARYGKMLVAVVAGGLLSIALLNALVDPYGLLPLPTLPRVNEAKPGIDVSRVRVVASMRLAARRYDSLILGSSRVGSLDTEHPALRGPVLRVALPAATMFELHSVFQYAAERQQLRMVVIGLDLFSFTRQRRLRADFARSAFAGHSPWSLLARSLISGEATWASVSTLGQNLRGDGAAAGPPELAELFPLLRSPQKAAEAVLKAQLTRSLYPCYVYGSKPLQLLGRDLRRAREQGIQLRLFISPIHALQLEVLERVGLLATFERWKRDLTALVARERELLPPGEKGRIALWDFSGYSPFTTEEVPRSETEMAWYYELSHYRESLGDVVLERMFDPSAPLSYADGFGTMLTPGTIESHLRSLHQARWDYVEHHPLEVAWVRGLVDETAPLREGLCTRRR